MGDQGDDPSGVGRQYAALLEVSEAIVSHRDLPSLLHDLAGRLRQVVQFHYVSLVLYDAQTDTMRLHVLESWEPVPSQAMSEFVLLPHEDPAGQVWQTQQPFGNAAITTFV